MKRFIVIFFVVILLISPSFSTIALGQTNSLEINTNGEIAGIAYGNNTVYALLHNGTLQAYNESTGEMKWSQLTNFLRSAEGLHFSKQSNRLYALGSYPYFKGSTFVTRWEIRSYMPNGTFTNYREGVRYQIAVDQSRILSGTGSSTSVTLSTYDTNLNPVSSTSQSYIQSTVAIQTETNTGVVFRNNNTHIYNYTNWNHQRTFSSDGNLNVDLWAVNNNSLLTENAMYNYQTGAQYFTYSNSQAVAIHPNQNTGYVLDIGSIQTFDQSGNVIDTLSIAGSTTNKNNAHLKTIIIDGSVHLLYGNGQYVGVVDAPASTTQTPTQTPTDIQTPIQTGGDTPPITSQLAILLSSCIVISFVISLKLRSTFGIFGGMLMIVALVTTFITTFPILWFWIATLLEIFILVLAWIAYTRAATRGKG